MYTGTLIDDLMITVTRVEEHARLQPIMLPVEAAPRVEAYPAFSTFAYEWAMEHAVIGVA